jgi:hypothetical protein
MNRAHIHGLADPSGVQPHPRRAALAQSRASATRAWRLTKPRPRQMLPLGRHDTKSSQQGQTTRP